MIKNVKNALFERLSKSLETKSLNDIYDEILDNYNPIDLDIMTVRNKLHEYIDLGIISGDTEYQTMGIAEKLGIYNYYSEVLPEDKEKILISIKA